MYVVGVGVYRYWTPLVLDKACPYELTGRSYCSKIINCYIFLNDTYTFVEHASLHSITGMTFFFVCALNFVVVSREKKYNITLVCFEFCFYLSNLMSE